MAPSGACAGHAIVAGLYVVLSRTTSDMFSPEPCNGNCICASMVMRFCFQIDFSKFRTQPLLQNFMKRQKPEGKRIDQEDVVANCSSRLGSDWIDTELTKDVGL